VDDGGRRISVPERGLAGHRIRCARRPGRQTPGTGHGILLALLDRELDPAAEVPRLKASRAVPADIDRVQESPPPQQVHAIRAQCGYRPSGSQQLSQERGHRGNRRPAAVEQPVGLPPVIGGDELPRAGYNKTRQVPVRLRRLDHAGKLSARLQRSVRSRPNSPVSSVNGACDARCTGQIRLNGNESLRSETISSPESPRPDAKEAPAATAGRVRLLLEAVRANDEDVVDGTAGPVTFSAFPVMLVISSGRRAVVPGRHCSASPRLSMSDRARRRGVRAPGPESPPTRR